MNNTIITYIALGSNLNAPEQQLQRALFSLQQLPKSRFITQSQIHISKPFGNMLQPHYHNAVCSLGTQLSANELLQALQLIEQQHGRVRTTARWQARPLDLDILLYGNLIIETPELCVPHPRMTERDFVLIPLAEIAPELKMPDGRSIKMLIHALQKDQLTLLHR